MKDGTAGYCFARSVQCEGNIERVERWSDEPLPADMRVVGADVAVPVRVRLFTSVVGPRYRLTTVDAEAGEEF